MTALALESSVHPLPDVQLLTPRGVETVTPLTDAIGLEPSRDPSFLLQARQLATSLPDSRVALARLAQAEQALGNVAEAVEAASRTLEYGLPPESPSIAATYVAATLLARNGVAAGEDFLGSLDNPLARVSWANLALAHGNTEEAIRRLGDLKIPAAQALRGYCLVAGGEYQRAVSEYRAALRAGRGSLDVLINLGYALAHLGSVSKAIRVTRQATLKSPTNHAASYNLARFLQMSGDNELAVRELDRIAKTRPDDHRSRLHQAWAHSNLLNQTREALRLLIRAQGDWAGSTDHDARAELDASVAYLHWKLGERANDRTRQLLWRSLRRMSSPSPEIVRMLASLMGKCGDAAELGELLATYGDCLDALDERLLAARRFLLEGDMDAALEAAEVAALHDVDGSTEAAGMAAYLLGEVRGDYAQGALIAARAFRFNPDESLGNNLAFCLSLDRRPNEAARVLSLFDERQLPFHGATRGLLELARGNVSTGMRLYREAEEAIRREGDVATADYVALRCGLARIQLGVDASSDVAGHLLAIWPADRDDPRWRVIQKVAARVGIEAPSD